MALSMLRSSVFDSMVCFDRADTWISSRIRWAERGVSTYTAAGLYLPHFLCLRLFTRADRSQVALLQLASCPPPPLLAGGFSERRRRPPVPRTRVALHRLWRDGGPRSRWPCAGLGCASLRGKRERRAVVRLALLSRAVAESRGAEPSHRAAGGGADQRLLIE